MEWLGLMVLSWIMVFKRSILGWNRHNDQDALLWSGVLTKKRFFRIFLITGSRFCFKMRAFNIEFLNLNYEKIVQHLTRKFVPVVTSKTFVFCILRYLLSVGPILWSNFEWFYGAEVSHHHFKSTIDIFCLFAIYLLTLPFFASIISFHNRFYQSIRNPSCFFLPFPKKQ